MNLEFFYVNNTTGEILDHAHYVDKISSLALEAFRSGEFRSIKEANARYFEMDHGYTKHSYNADDITLAQAIKQL